MQMSTKQNKTKQYKKRHSGKAEENGTNQSNTVEQAGISTCMALTFQLMATSPLSQLSFTKLKTGNGSSSTCRESAVQSLWQSNNHVIGFCLPSQSESKKHKNPHTFAHIVKFLKRVVRQV